MVFDPTSAFETDDSVDMSRIRSNASVQTCYLVFINKRKTLENGREALSAKRLQLQLSRNLSATYI